MADLKEHKSILILTFLLSGERFGLKVSDIMEVNRLPGVLSVHGIQEHVLGLINLHGKGIPVIALDRLLKLESGGRDKELFITLKTKNGPLCFLVDELIGFEEIRDDQIRNLKDVAFEFDASYLQFVYFGLNSMVPVLDVNFLTEMRGESGN